MKHLRQIFFPETFSEKYSYLGYVTFCDGDERYLNGIRPLILEMDKQAKPFWCPRWFLRLLHYYGNGNTVHYVKNRFLHNLHRKLTNGLLITDWKTKWDENDVCIYLYGNNELFDMANEIEKKFYNKEI